MITIQAASILALCSWISIRRERNFDKLSRRKKLYQSSMYMRLEYENGSYGYNRNESLSHRDHQIIGIYLYSVGMYFTKDFL